MINHFLMLQRVAYSIYWMSRYLKRADCYARLMAVQTTLAKRKPMGIKQQWHQILVAMADDVLFYEKHENPTIETVLHFMTFEEENPNSIVNIIKTARNNARSIRETLRQENWEFINICYLKTQSFKAKTDKNLAFYQLFFEEINTFYSQFLIEIDKKIIKNEAVLFMQLGSNIEQADKISRVLDLGFFNPTGIDSTINLAIQQSVSAGVNQDSFSNTTDLIRHLILGENETVSIKNCVSKIEAILNQISIQSSDSQVFKSISNLNLFLDTSNINSFSRIGLSKAMDDFQIKNNALDQAIFEQYFVFKPTHFGLNGGEQ
jgi:uncharacterized alpha-E superfamily protein